MSTKIRISVTFINICARLPDNKINNVINIYFIAPRGRVLEAFGITSAGKSGYLGGM